MLDGPIRNAGCQLDSSIEKHQKLVNSKRNKVNSGRKDMRRLLSLKNDTELKKLKSSVKKILTADTILGFQ